MNRVHADSSRLPQAVSATDAFGTPSPAPDNTGTAYSPRRLIWSLNKASEYRYDGVLPHRRGVPFLLVYAPIGRPTILDLCPGHNFIHFMVEAGFDVFLLSNFSSAHPGNVPGELIALGAAAAAPQDAFVRPLMQFWASLDDPSFIRSWCAHWNWAVDLVPMTGALFRDLVVELYRNNSLFCGELTIAGRRVDLRSITANLLNVIAMDDHVSPPCQSRWLLEIVGSRDKQELRVPGTHVESMAGFHAPVHTWPSIRAWLDERSNPTNSTDR